MFAVRPSQDGTGIVLWQVPNDPRKRGMQCRSCGILKDSGAKLFVCSRCKIDSYCSKACQKTNWAAHRPRCREVVRQNKDIVHKQTYAAMATWQRKHLSMIQIYAIRALNAFVDPSVGTHTVFKLDIVRRPAETRPAHLFEVVGVYAVPMSLFPAAYQQGLRAIWAEEEALARARRGAEDTQPWGMFLLILREVQVDIATVAAQVFDVVAPADMSQRPWKEALMAQLNEGRLGCGAEVIGEVVNR